MASKRGGGGNHSKMAASMAKSFAKRRKQVLSKKILGVDKALSTYPALKDLEELRREFQRIVGKNVKDFEMCLDVVLKKFEERKLEPVPCPNAYCTEALELLRKDGETNLRKNAARMILYTCAQSEKKWWGKGLKIVEKKKKFVCGRAEPTIKVRGSPFGEKCAAVYCEGKIIVREVNLLEAVLTCYYLYYAFNIVYPEEDEDIYLPFDKIVKAIA